MRLDILPLKLSTRLLLCLLLIPIQLISQSTEQGGPYLATGIRIGDVSQTEAIVWTRLTFNKKRITGAPQPIALYTDPETGKKHTRKTRRDKNGMIYFPQGYDINTKQSTTEIKSNLFLTIAYSLINLTPRDLIVIYNLMNLIIKKRCSKI